MTYKLKLNKTIAPEKSVIEKWADSPVGWWDVTTEGDCEGRSTKQLGTHYGHVAEIAFSLKDCGYSFHFEKTDGPCGVYGSHEDHHKERQAVRTIANITLPPITYKGGEKELAKWLDCPEVAVKPCNYYGAYTLELKA
jgi:hypothetical protein